MQGIEMEWILLAAIAVAAIICIIVAYKLLKFTVKIAVWLILNALGGLLILLVSNFVFSMGIPYDVPTLLVCAFGGVPGAICIVILALLGMFI
ncbi:MAG: pro-sigmaK processing inhibitor BofA family protein [Methanocella sp.]